MSQDTPPAPAVVFDRVSFAFDEHVILQNISFSVPTGAMWIVLGASGSGKSIMLKLILGLIRPDSGRIFVNGHRVDGMPERDLMRVRADIGMSFQENALFDSLTVAENVGYRLYEETKMPLDEVHARVMEVLGFVGLADYPDRKGRAIVAGIRIFRLALVIGARGKRSSRSRSRQRRGNSQRCSPRAWCNVTVLAEWPVRADPEIALQEV